VFERFANSDFYSEANNLGLACHTNTNSFTRNAFRNRGSPKAVASPCAKVWSGSYVQRKKLLLKNHSLFAGMFNAKQSLEILKNVFTFCFWQKKSMFFLCSGYSRPSPIDTASRPGGKAIRNYKGNSRATNSLQELACWEDGQLFVFWTPRIFLNKNVALLNLG
jgi:hypothetical protein